MSQRPCVPFDLAAAVEESSALIEAADAAREERERRAAPYVRHDPRAGDDVTPTWDPVVAR